jgi:hypothetical protein
LRVDDRPAGFREPGPHVRDGDRGRARVPPEQRVAAEHLADADAKRAADQVVA